MLIIFLKLSTMFLKKSLMRVILNQLKEV